MTERDAKGHKKGRRLQIRLPITSTSLFFVRALHNIFLCRSLLQMTLFSPLEQEKSPKGERSFPFRFVSPPTPISSAAVSPFVIEPKASHLCIHEFLSRMSKTALRRGNVINLRNKTHLLLFITLNIPCMCPYTVHSVYNIMYSSLVFGLHFYMRPSRTFKSRPFFITFGKEFFF